MSLKGGRRKRSLKHLLTNFLTEIPVYLGGSLYRKMLTFMPLPFPFSECGIISYFKFARKVPEWFSYCFLGLKDFKSSSYIS